jgi:hypothetical protein
MMFPRRSRVVIELAAMLLACEARVEPPGDAGVDGSEVSATTDGESATGSMSCTAADHCSDPLSCGAEGTQCVGALNIGECVDGFCGPRLSSCFGGESTATCEEICARAGGTCAERGCDAMTVYTWRVGHEDECVGGVDWGMAALAVGCEEALDFSDPASHRARCCCDFSE